MIQYSGNCCYVILYGPAPGEPVTSDENARRWREAILQNFTWWYFTPNAFVIQTNMAAESIRNVLHAAVSTMRFVLLQLQPRGERRVALGPESFVASEWLDEKLGKGLWQ
jgi:hypothetical protein